jgi:hypothetical protein
MVFQSRLMSISTQPRVCYVLEATGSYVPGFIIAGVAYLSALAIISPARAQAREGAALRSSSFFFFVFGSAGRRSSSTTTAGVRSLVLSAVGATALAVEGSRDVAERQHHSRCSMNQADELLDPTPRPDVSLLRRLLIRV